MATVERDNLTWVEEVILNNLEETVEEFPLEEGSHSESQTNQVLRLNNDTKLFIAEIEMRDENTFTEDRLPTLSRIINARIKYLIEGEDEEKSHFWVIKIPSVSPQERELSRIANVAKREICFYTEILPALKLWVESQYVDHILEFNVPPCFYGKYLRPNDPEPDGEVIEHILEAESLLVLQDLRANDFGKRYFGEGLAMSEAMAAVGQIVKFHAISWAMQVKSGETLKWKELHHWTDFVTLYEALFKRGYVTFENYLSNTTELSSGGEILIQMANLNANIRGVLTKAMKPAPSQGFPTTLIHMDLWSDNLLFRIRESDKDAGLPLEECDLDCVIVDWQMVGLGRPSHDLALLTLISMDAPTRRESAQTLLEYYYQCFQMYASWFELEMPFSYESLIEEYSQSCVLALVMAISSFDLVMQEESTQQRLMEAINDLIEDGLLNDHAFSKFR